MPQYIDSRICLAILPTHLNQHYQSLAVLTSSVTTSLLSPSTGILTCFPSTTLLSLALGADSPCVDYRCAGNLRLSACGFFSHIIVTHVSIRTSVTSSNPLKSPSSACRTLLYHCVVKRNPQLRCIVLAPLHLPRKTTRPVSYYAFFKRWLLLSQPPGCLCLLTSFST